MTPCYINTYSLTGPCVVDVNSIQSKEPKPQAEFPDQRCLIHFKNGTELLIDEPCDAIDNKAPYCTPYPQGSMPVYPKSK